jgi:hypothetical protein
MLSSSAEGGQSSPAIDLHILQDRKQTLPLLFFLDSDALLLLPILAPPLDEELGDSAADLVSTSAESASDLCLEEPPCNCCSIRACATV